MAPAAKTVKKVGQLTFGLPEADRQTGKENAPPSRPKTTKHIADDLDDADEVASSQLTRR